MEASLKADDLLRVLAGDAPHISTLKTYGQSEIARVAGSLSSEQLKVNSHVVRRVLANLLQKSISSEQAQGWASFIKRGCVSTKETPVYPISICYEPDQEDQIAEVLSRLDELGDLIDGTIDDNELRNLIDELNE